jgi:hypothetical protein
MTQMSTAASELTDQECLFFSRVAIKQADGGLGFEDACRSVIADDRRVFAAYKGMSSYDRGHVSHLMARGVYAAAHVALAAAA